MFYLIKINLSRKLVLGLKVNLNKVCQIDHSLFKFSNQICFVKKLILGLKVNF